MSTLNKRVEKLEEIVANHLKESGFIQSNLKWNTVLTGGIAVAVMGRLLFEFLFHK